MDNFYYNTHTISDSDNDSIIIIEDHQTNVSQGNDDPMSLEEPDFFNQIIQHQRKRKKSPSPETLFEVDHVQNDVYTIDSKNSSVLIIDEPVTNICEGENQNELYNSNIPETDIYTIVNSKQTTEMIKPKRKKRLTKEEIEEKKREEKAQKTAKKKLVEELKRLNPKECMKYMMVVIDINLQNQDYSEQILSEIQSTDAKYTIESVSIVPHSITWSREIADSVFEEENFMMLIWDYEYVTDLITSNQLLKNIKHIQLHKTQLSLIIYCTADQLKKTKSKKNGSRSDMSNSLEQMMLSCHVSFRFIDNKNDIGLAVCYFTKSIAQKPYKLNKYKEEQEGCDWYASGHTKNCVTVDKNGTGLTQLWRQMLSQFPLCALETSEAIASVYESPIALLEAYDKCSSRLEGETLLQDIPVRRGFGPLCSNRRIGPELSKKIYIFFTDNTGCTTLSQE